MSNYIQNFILKVKSSSNNYAFILAVGKEATLDDPTLKSIHKSMNQTFVEFSNSKGDEWEKKVITIIVIGIKLIEALFEVFVLVLKSCFKFQLFILTASFHENSVPHRT